MHSGESKEERYCCLLKCTFATDVQLRCTFAKEVIVKRTLNDVIK